MGAKVFIALTGAATGFMLYALFNFLKEGRRHPPRTRPEATVAVLRQSRVGQQERPKAA